MRIWACEARSGSPITRATGFPQLGARCGDRQPQPRRVVERLAHAQAVVHDALLRHVADVRALLGHRTTADGDLPGARPDDPGQRAQQRRLAGAALPDHRRELPHLEPQRGAGEELAPPLVGRYEVGALPA